MPLGIGAPELIIALVVIVIVFGTGKLTGVGGALGKAVRDFRNAVSSDEPGSTEHKSPTDRT